MKLTKPRVILRRQAPRPLRPDQQTVLDAFVAFQARLATHEDEPRWAFIVLPPRTGKTVIAARIAEQAGIHAAFIVPTRVLVHQTRREFARHAPGVPVGTWFGEEKETVAHGINITTYSSLQNHGHAWCPNLASAGLVFCDEAHHALTSGRIAALREAFPENAIRVALTATPDYDARRQLKNVFPRPIASMELRDALEGGLLAPSQVHVAEVDVDGSEVEIVAGDYRPDQLARLLSDAPVLHAAMTFRYQAPFRKTPCMIACLSRQQAADLVGYFDQRRPQGTTCPALILGETPADERKRILQDFDDGRIDTLVQVGVLIEGWTSRRCKLLLDLAPGRSRVRATQKYFRVMTRDGDSIAHIVVLVPRDLPRPPVLPMDLLLDPGEAYTCGSTIGGGGRRTPVSKEEVSPIRGVRLIQRVVVCARLGVPRLDPHRLGDVKAVLVSCPDLNPTRLPGKNAFEGLYFQHPLFSGTGRMLLRWLHVTSGGYDAWLCSLFPREIADRLLGEEEEEETPLSLTRWIEGEDDEPATTERDLLNIADPGPSPEDVVIRRQLHRYVDSIVKDALQGRDRTIVMEWAGYSGEERSIADIAESLERSRSRVGQILKFALWTCGERLLHIVRPDETMGDEDLLLPLSRYDHKLARRLHMRLAHRFLAGGRARSALRVLHRYLDAHPNNAEAQVLAIETAIDHDDPAEAATFVDRFVEEGWCDSRLVAGKLLHEHARYREAFRILASLPDPTWMAGLALLRAGAEEEALSWIEGHGDRGDEWMAYLQVLLQFRLGRPQGEAMLRALATKGSLVDLVQHDEEGEFIKATRDLWMGTPGALETVDQWMKAPPVVKWLEEHRLRDWTNSRAVWDRRHKVVGKVQALLASTGPLPSRSS